MTKVWKSLAGLGEIHWTEMKKCLDPSLTSPATSYTTPHKSFKLFCGLLFLTICPTWADYTACPTSWWGGRDQREMTDSISESQAEKWGMGWDRTGRGGTGHVGSSERTVLLLSTSKELIRRILQLVSWTPALYTQENCPQQDIFSKNNAEPHDILYKVI